MNNLLNNDKLLIDSIPSVLICIDTNDKITHWNRAAERTFGIPAREVIGCSLLECKINWDWKKVLKRIGMSSEENHASQWGDIRYVAPDGHERLFDVLVSPIVNHSQKPVGFILLIDDETDRKNLESQIQQAQKLEAIGELAGGIAHEINTPIQFVNDNLHFLSQSWLDLERLLETLNATVEPSVTANEIPHKLEQIREISEEIELEYLRKEIPAAIEQSAEGVARVAKIVGAMKAFSHPDQKEKVLTDLNKSLEETITVARNEWKYVADVETHLDPSLPRVLCLAGEMNQVFLNIIVNAAQAIRDVVESEGVAKGKITIETTHTDEEVIIRISDTGTGIPESVLPRIFDPFFTTKEIGKGTGQGLALSYNIVVEKHHGTISCESEVGKGTTFTICLPLHPEEE